MPKVFRGRDGYIVENQAGKAFVAHPSDRRANKPGSLPIVCAFQGNKFPVLIAARRKETRQLRFSEVAAPVQPKHIGTSEGFSQGLYQLFPALHPRPPPRQKADDGRMGKTCVSKS